MIPGLFRCRRVPLSGIVLVRNDASGANSGAKFEPEAGAIAIKYGTGRANYSFDINSARQRLDKMIRESERLEATSDRTEKSDHAINAAMDGWHIHEWVWDEMK